MLAIFDGRAAKRPECMKMPHKNAVSAMKDSFLVNYFTSVNPDSIVISSEASFTFAYSLGASSTSHLQRYHFAYMDGVYCMYQGFIKDIEAVKRDFHISEIDNEGIVRIRAFQIMRQLGQRIPKETVDKMFGNSLSVFYEIPSKLIVLAGGTYHDLSIYWGIDARFNLVVSDDKNFVEKACGFSQAFLRGQVYACCKGRTGQEALFLNKQLPYKVDFTDKYFPISKPVETITKMILQADKDRTQPYSQKWEPPLPDFLKINTDVAKFKDGMLGIGILIRNSKGDVEFAASRKADITVPELEELQPLMEGFYTAVEFSIQRCVCESVHLKIDKIEKFGISSTELVESMIGNVGDCIEGNVSEFGISFVSSCGNKGAHRLALLAKTYEHVFWEKEIPECIAAIVEAERPNVDTISSAFQELDI